MSHIQSHLALHYLRRKYKMYRIYLCVMPLALPNIEYYDIGPNSENNQYLSPNKGSIV